MQSDFFSSAWIFITIISFLLFTDIFKDFLKSFLNGIIIKVFNEKQQCTPDTQYPFVIGSNINFNKIYI